MGDVPRRSDAAASVGPRRGSSVLHVSRSDLVKVNVDFLADDPATMTHGRRLALRLARRHRWYNPRLGAETEAAAYVDMDAVAGGGGDDNAEEEGSSHSFASFHRSLRRSPARREVPSLEKAWAYFEHVTLPRYLDHSAAVAASLRGSAAGKANVVPSVPCGEWLPCRVRGSDYETDYTAGEVRIMDRAEPGESRYPTKLYSPLWTPLNQMGDFGLGVGLYFTTLRSITILVFIAGLINLPNMMYFAGEEYSNRQEGVNIALKGSAVCSVQEFVPCPSCSVDEFAANRIAVVEDLVFVVKNYCDGVKLPLVLTNYATLFFVVLSMIQINRHLEAKEAAFDEDEQTAQDYSIVVENPPPDATDPEEWKAFFAAGFGPNVHVTCCTVARDNYLLVRALVRRREILQKLKWKLPPGTPFDTVSLVEIAKFLKTQRKFFGKVKSLIFPDVPALVDQLKKINTEMQQLSLREFPAKKIFVTFETEKSQRTILKCLSAVAKTAKNNNVLKMDNPDHLFRSELALDVSEPEEPSTIRWQDLSDKYLDRLIKMLMTAFAWACSMALVAFIIYLCRYRSSTFAAYAIAFFNEAFPQFAKTLVKFESHPSEGHYQTSLYIKIAAFRWINTALIVTMITPFTETLTSGNDNLLDGVCKIFFAEIVTSNLKKLLDPEGFLHRHYLAPRAGSQEEMNNHMRGAEWHLAERYSSMSKILFLTLWYCAAYPFGFFFCALALFINYYAERFSLMRTWRRAPRVGSHASRFSRRYALPVILSAMAIASSYFWSGFPYDNLCKTADVDGNDDDATGDYVGNWDVVSTDGSQSTQVTVSEGDNIYKRCQQSLFWYGNTIKFPAIPYWQKGGEEWMTEEQELLTNMYGWTSLVLLVGVCLWIANISIRKPFFRSNYESCGEDQGIPFSDVATISSYVPQVKSDLFSYPLLAVDTDDVYEELYEWKDPDKPYSYYDLTRDAKEVLKGCMMPNDEIGALFSTLKHWPPEQAVQGAKADVSDQADAGCQ